MTLRVNIEIVPYGNEEAVYPVFRIDISNLGMIRNLGFGHEICTYQADLYRYNNETQQNLLDAPTWEKVRSVSIEEHDRRDGSIELVRKATSLLELGE